MQSVLVLRDERGSRLVQRLRALGFAASRVAPIEYEPVAFTPPERADWAALTSAQAVRVVAAHWPRIGRVASVGPATTAALTAAGIRVDLEPTVASGAGLADAMPVADPGGTVWLPRSDLAAPELPDALAAKGWDVLTQTVYRTVRRPDVVAEALAQDPDVVVVWSPSAADTLPAGSPPCIAIGEPTARALADAAIPVAAAASTPTDDAVIAALTKGMS